MKKEGVGYFAGFFATLTLGEINLIFGILCALVMIWCNVPTGLTKWRNFLYDYRKTKERAKYYGAFGFVLYCFGGLQFRAKSLPKDDGDGKHSDRNER